LMFGTSCSAMARYAIRPAKKKGRREGALKGGKCFWGNSEL
jgi:hypothetical protein